MPGLDRVAAVALAKPASPGGAAFLRTTGTDRLLVLRRSLLEASATSADPATAAAVTAIDTELTDTRGLASYREETAFLRSLPDSTAREVAAARREAADLFESVGLDLATKLTRISSLQARLLALGDEYGALQLWPNLTMLEQRSAHHDAAEACRRRWVAGAIRLGRLDEHGRGYTQVMMAGMLSGWSPAERDTMRQLIERTQAAGLARTAASLLSQQAYGAFTASRFHAARVLFQDAIETGARLGQPASTLPAMVFLMRMYSIFECWDQVALLAARATQLLDEAAVTWDSAASLGLTRLQLRNLEARSAAARGREDAAAALFAANLAAARELPFEEGSFVCRQWIETMIDRERADLAATGIAAAESLSTALDLPGLRARLPWWRAWLSSRRGDPAMAARHLDEFMAGASRWPEPVADLEYRALALRVELEAREDPDRAWRRLPDGWRRLQERLLRQDGGAEVYLDLGRNPHLHAVASGLAAGDPGLGYGLELLWREAMSPGGRPLDGVDDLRAEARARAAAARRHLADTGAVHCLYRTGPFGVTRWTADGAGVVEENLAAPVDTLRRRTERALAALATDPGAIDAPVPAGLAAALATLAADLLPDRLRQPLTAPHRLAVTGDGFLSQLPFSALNLGAPGDYRPLAATTSIVWCRHGLATVPATGRETMVVVGDPELDAAVRRRFALAGELPGARAEALRVAARWPGSGAVIGAAATVDRVRDLWDTADVFYFAGHAVNDVQVPFASWLALGTGDGIPTCPGIGLQEILEHDFRRCRVVVLSGCATGRPFVDGLSVAPSLGDGFLDAGVDAAIQTFWLVRDEDPLLRLDEVLAAWSGQGLDLASALAAEQRRVFAGPRGVRHPFWWATWTVAQSGSGR